MTPADKGLKKIPSLDTKNDESSDEASDDESSEEEILKKSQTIAKI